MRGWQVVAGERGYACLITMVCRDSGRRRMVQMRSAGESGHGSSGYRRPSQTNGLKQDVSVAVTIVFLGDGDFGDLDAALHRGLVAAFETWAQTVATEEQWASGVDSTPR
jgi:hypothetical protein